MADSGESWQDDLYRAKVGSPNTLGRHCGVQGVLLDEDFAEGLRLVEDPGLHAGEELVLRDKSHCRAIMPKTRLGSEGLATGHPHRTRIDAKGDCKRENGDVQGRLRSNFRSRGREGDVDSTFFRLLSGSRTTVANRIFLRIFACAVAQSNR